MIILGEMGRRSFVRRLFAIGAGIAVGGELIRQRTLVRETGTVLGLTEPTFPGWQPLPLSPPFTEADFDRLMQQLWKQSGGDGVVRAAMRDQTLYGYHNPLEVRWDDAAQMVVAEYQPVLSFPWRKSLEVRT